jgi:hypothetical protein
MTEVFATTTTARSTTPTTAFTWLMTITRGPVIVMVAVLSLTLPFLQEYGLKFWNEVCSISLLFHLLLLGWGIFWCLHDASHMVQSFLRSFCDNLLNHMVLDHVLKSIYDPETGWLTCLTGVLVGTSTMYGLKMSEEQRCQLVQSSLRLPNEQMAHSILLQPGGCKALLPIPVQNWLQQQQQQQQPHPPPATAQATTSGQKLKNKKSLPMKSKTRPVNGLALLWSSSNDPNNCSNNNIISMDMDTISTSPDDREEDEDIIIFDNHTIQRARGLSFQKYDNLDDEESPFTYHDKTIRKDTQQQRQQQQQQQQHDPFQEQQEEGYNISSIPEETEQDHIPNPLTVFATILKDMAHEQIIKPYAEAYPISTVENIGIVAAMAAVLVTAMQLVVRQSSSRHNTIMSRFIPTTTTAAATTTAVVLSSSVTAVTLFGSILAREAILGNIYNQQSMKLACTEILSRVMNKVKRKIIPSYNKTKTFLAMLILLLLLQRKKPQPTRPLG